MARISEILIQNALEQPSKTVQAGVANFQALAGVAQKKQQLDINQQQLEINQEQLNFKMLSHLPKQYEFLNNATTPEQAKMGAKHIVSSYNSIFGQPHPDLESTLLKERETLNEVRFAVDGLIASKSGTERVSQEEIAAIAEEYQVNPTAFMKRVRDFNNKQRAEKQALLRAKAGFKQKQALAEQQIAATGRKALDTTAGKLAAKFDFEAGSETMRKNIDLLESAITDLEAPGELANKKILGLVPGEGAVDLFSPQLAKVRDKVKSAIQGTLRPILGAQFAQKEGEAIFDRAFNARLSDEENIRRARVEVDSLKRRAEATRQAMMYFKRNQTMVGFQGNTGYLDTRTGEVVPSAPRSEAPKTVPTSEPSQKMFDIVARMKKKSGEKAIEAFLRAKKVSEENIKLLLKGQTPEGQ